MFYLSIVSVVVWCIRPEIDLWIARFICRALNTFGNLPQKKKWENRLRYWYFNVVLLGGRDLVLLREGEDWEFYLSYETGQVLKKLVRTNNVP